MNPTQALINLKNLRYNYTAIKKKTKTKVMAVVKADAYGHGMVNSVRALENLKEKPEFYGVALLDEAIELRNAKVTNQPILCFAPFNRNYINIYLEKNIIPSITTSEQVNQVSKSLIKNKLKVHVNVNTGMNRLGIDFRTALKEIIKLTKIKKILLDGVYSHLATSDEKDKTFAELQLQRFNNLVGDLKEKNINFGLAHVANSGAILDMPNSYFDMVRVGISLYGYYPSLETTESIKLKPVMSVVSKLSTIYNINKGESVGYGRCYIASRKTRCGTVPIGYADGLLRGLSNKINVIIDNQLYQQIGRVSMDRISIKLKNNVELKTNCKVILLGETKDHKIYAWDWAKELDTIPYEITCSISKRIPRKYIGKV